MALQLGDLEVIIGFRVPYGFDFFYCYSLSVVEMRMLRWICGHTRMDRVRSDDIRDCLGVAPIEEKLVQHRLRWFGHAQRILSEAPVHCGVLNRDINVRRGNKKRFKGLGYT